MKYIKLYEDLEFDPNNFRKLRKDIKAITIELVDDGFRVQTFEVEDDNVWDNFDFYVKIYKRKTSFGFKIKEVDEYIEMVKDYIDNYYTYRNLVVFYDGVKTRRNDFISQVEIEIGDIKKK